VALAWAGQGGVAAADGLAFDGEKPIELTKDGAVVKIFNDGPSSVSKLQVTAFVAPQPSTGTARVSVPVALDFGQGAGTPAPAALPAGAMVQAILSRPVDAPIPGTGVLTVTALDAEGATLVARRALEVPKVLIAPGIDSWTAVSTWRLPKDGPVAVGRPVPLAQGSCSDQAEPSAYVVAGDRSSKVVALCAADNQLQMRVDDFSGVGVYKGTMAFGDQKLALEIRRTLALWLALIPIVLGFALAIWSQNRMAGSRAQLLWWLRRINGRTHAADVLFYEKAGNTDWDRYRVSPAVAKETKTLRDELGNSKRGLPRLLSWLPWPTGEGAEARASLIARIGDVDRFVEDWPAFADALRQASDRVALASSAYAPTPGWLARWVQIKQPGTAELPLSELVDRRDFVDQLPDAIEVMEQLAALVEYLDALSRESSSASWTEPDRLMLARARQKEREANAALHEVVTSTEVLDVVAPLAERATSLTARLPRLAGVPKKSIEEARTATAGKDAAVSPTVALFRRFVQRLAGRQYVATQGALVLVTLLVAVWSGLSLLYLDKAWGTPADFLSAFAWGFVSTTLISPVLGLLQGLASRPAATTAVQQT